MGNVRSRYFLEGMGNVRSRYFLEGMGNAPPAGVSLHVAYSDRVKRACATEPCLKRRFVSKRRFFVTVRACATESQQGIGGGWRQKGLKRGALDCTLPVAYSQLRRMDYSL